MHLTGPLQTAIVIVYILLLVFETVHSTSNMDKLVSTTIKSTTKSGSRNRTFRPKKQSPMMTVRLVHMQLRNARRTIQNETTRIRKFYTQVNILSSNVFNFEWLPKEHFKWFKTHVRHFDKHKKISTILPILSESLRTFESTFGEMLTFDSKNQHAVSDSWYQERKKLLENIVESLNTTFRQIRNDISMMKMTIEENANLTEVKRGTKWNSNPDYTTTMVQDWGVITTYYSFIKDWLQITLGIYEEFCEEKWKNHRCHIYIKNNSKR